MKIESVRRTGLMLACGVILVLFLGAGCGGRMPEDLGVEGGALRACPPKPNCVSSFAQDEGHAIEALAITGDERAAWAALRDVVAQTEGAGLETETDGYMHAVYTSKLMRYRDDVEFLLDASAGKIDVRSASRVGFGDMGVNRDRIEALRAALAERGVVADGRAD